MLRRNTGIPPYKNRVERAIRTVEVDGVALKVAERRKFCTYPELARGGQKAPGPRRRGKRPLEHCGAVFRSRPRPAPSSRAPPAVRAAASPSWARRWRGALSVAVQLAVARTALGRAWPRVASCSTQGRGRATARHSTVCSTWPAATGPAALTCWAPCQPETAGPALPPCCPHPLQLAPRLLQD